MIIADASVIIGHFRGDRACTTVLRRHLARGEVLVPTLVAFELWKGVRSPLDRQSVQELLDAMRQDPFVPAMAQLAGEVQRQQRRAGKERPIIDLLIASHALHHGAPLATLDRDYRGIEDLDVLKVREEA